MIAALAGRRIDPPGHSFESFPEANVGVVRDRVRELLESAGVHTLVSSAACGADLIGQDVARELTLRRRMVLPVAPALFRVSSVTDRGAHWGDVFDRVLAELDDPQALTVLDEGAEPSPSHEVYARTNTAILDLSAQLGGARGEAPIAIAVWDGRSRGPDDLTAHFIAVARARGLRVAELSTI